MKYTISTLIIAISLLGVTPAKAATIPDGSLIRGSQPAVYYITNDGKRLAFPNAATYFTWYPDFSTVKFVSDSELSSFPLAGNVTYRPGTRLLKLSSATTVYAVAHGGVLRPIMNQGAVRFEYGNNWSNLVDDLPDAFYTNYKLGDPIYAELDYLPSTALASSTTISSDRVAAVASAPAPDLATASVGLASVSGRIISIAVDPTNENVAYAGSASGGIWKTSNMGGSWSSLTERLASMHIGALAIDPTNSSTIYAGTGETYMPGDDWAYMGVYVSHDSGATWTLLSGTSGLQLSAVSSIAIDPTNTSHLYISGNTGVYVSVDAGATWNKTSLNGFVEQLMISSVNHNTIFATGSQTNLWRSKDGGATWIALAGWNANRGLPDNNPWFNRVTITQSSGKTLANGVTHVLYAAFADPFRIYRSDNEGDGWQEVSRQSFDAKNFAVVADPVDADTVFTAGSNLRRATQGGWTVKVMPMQYNDVRALAFAPSDSQVWYAATDSGVEVSIDNGMNWKIKSTGLNTTQWYALAVSPDGANVYGAVQDLSILRLNANATWDTLSWGTPKEIVADPSRSHVLYAISSDSKGVGRSTDNGQAFSAINGNLPVASGLAHLAIDPAATGTLYVASGANVYGTNDAGANWYLFGNNNSASAVASIAVNGLTHKVYVGRADGSIDELVPVYSSNPTAIKWANIYREPNAKPIAELSTVGGYVTVAFDTDWGTRVGRLSNGSGKWLFQDITGNLPDGAWLHAMAVDPANRNVIYVSHKAGAFRGVSTDSGKTWTWTRTEDGLPSVEVMDIAVSPTTGTVYYATWGRGLYQVTP
jgi:photosystem II stability/assembly factor-like uncharacterized protein